MLFVTTIYNYLTFQPLNLYSTRKWLFMLDDKKQQKLQQNKNDDNNDTMTKNNNNNNNSIIIDLYGEKILYNDYKDGGRFISKNVLQTIYRQRGDNELDSIFQLYDEQDNNPIQPKQDMLQHMEYCYHTMKQQQNSLSSDSSILTKADIELGKFYEHYTYQLPDWYNIQQIVRGQQVYLSYLGSIGLTLYYRSLVPGFSIPKIANVLNKTNYLTPPSTSQSITNRLLDTGAFLMSILYNNEECLLPITGDGWKSAIQVRILHAKVRYNILKQRKRKQQQQEKEEEKKDEQTMNNNDGNNDNASYENNDNNDDDDNNDNDIPINQEDLAAVLLAFSMNTLLGCEMILGFPIPGYQQLDLLAFWRYIGWLLGVDCIEYNTTNNNNEDNNQHHNSHDNNKSNVDNSNSDDNILHNNHHPLPDSVIVHNTVNDTISYKNEYNVNNINDNNISHNFVNHNNNYKPIDPCGPGWIINNPNPLQHAISFSYSSMIHLMKPNQLSVQICHHLLRMGKTYNKDSDNAKSSSSSSDTSTDMINDHWFYFRSYQCRRFIGNPLADALQLPYHPNWLVRMKLYTCSNIYLWILRLYTYAALPYSPFRNYIIQYHQKYAKLIYEKWKDGTIRKSRNDNNNNNKKKDQDNNNNNQHDVVDEGTDDPNTIPSTSGSSCPFAMVAPPIQ